MTIDTTPHAAAEHAAQQAIGAAAKAENLQALAALADTADRHQQAAHIRGIVATTMAHLADDVSMVTREHAAQWQAWALGLSDALLLDAPAPVLRL
jgi:hypothetical protein